MGLHFSFRLHSMLQIPYSDSARYIEVYTLSHTHAHVLNYGELRINASHGDLTWNTVASRRSLIFGTCHRLQPRLLSFVATTSEQH
jgi:hypothetical protein